LLGEPVLRKAAGHVDGFLLIHTGNVGTAAAGFVVATEGQANNLTRDELGVLRLFLRPRPPLAAGPEVVGTGAATMDVSDSILTYADRIDAAYRLLSVIY